MIGPTTKGALLGYLTIFVNIITGLLYTPWMIKQIGISDYGLYTLINSFISYFLIDFGLGTAVSRYVSKYREEGVQSKIDEVLSVIVKVFAIIDFFIFIFLFVCYFYISEIFTSLTPDEIEKLKVIYCIAGLFSLLTFPFSYLNGVLIAYEKFVVLKFCEFAQRIVIVLLVVLCLLNGYGLNALVLVNSGVGFLIALYKLFYLKNSEIISIKLKYFNANLLARLFKFSSWVFIIGVASRFMYNIIPTLLGRYCNTREVAIFSIAMMIEGYVYSFASAINGLFLPRVMRITVHGRSSDELTRLMIKVGRIQLIIVGAIISGFIVSGKEFINLWLGPDFMNSYWVTLCLILPGLVSLIEEIGNTALVAINELKYRALFFIAASAISIIGGYLLIPKLGALGAGISVNIALIFCHIIAMNVLYRCKLHIDVMAFFTSTIICFIPVLVLCITCIYFFKSFTNLTGWIGLITTVGLYGILYIIFMWLVYLNKDEKFMLVNMLRK